jgi:hypothetical protein
MKPAASLILIVDAGAAIALIGAAVLGDASLHSNGLRVSNLAYDNIAFTVLAVCILSCIVAAFALARVARSWNRVEALGFLAAVLLGWLAASAFANASGDVTLNGASTEWVSWPAMLWLLGLQAAFAVRACDTRSRTDELAEQPHALELAAGPVSTGKSSPPAQ